VFFEPRKGHGLPFSPYAALVAPRPIGWISTLDPDGRANLAPFSFFNLLSPDPPIVAYSSTGPKDSMVNAEEGGEFVVSVATRAQAEAMNLTSVPVRRGIDEFAIAGLAQLPSRIVAPPRVAGSPAAMECVVTQIVELTDAAGASSGRWLVAGEIVCVHIDDAALKDGRFDIVAAGVIARCGYRDYTEVTELFAMEPPKPEPGTERGP
jgi:flavin reductase (DIM6/NTAB) family NADH-FMN oxidoreductase RutF